jgi:hypothetical protein
LALLAFSLCSPYSYSEEVYGTTNNAATFGLNWVMTNILPSQAGLEVNGLVYQYTAVKDPETGMIVYVQNEYADGSGYIFRNADDWTGLPGNTIRRKFALPNLGAELWGPGSIEVEGEGSVENASVVYSYRYDTCFDPQSDPNCPGYEEQVEVPEIAIYDPLQDPLVQEDLERKARIQEEEEEQERQRRREQWAVSNALEDLLADGNNPSLIDPVAEAMALALTSRVLPTNYYNGLEGREYFDTVVLEGGDIADNAKARRSNLAQQLLHQQMVDSQYESSQQETK